MQAQLSTERRISLMSDLVAVDFDKTYGKGIFLGIEPKMKRSDRANPKSPMVQGDDGNGKLQWTATIAAKSQLTETAKMENIAVTILSPQKPYERLPVGATVVVEGLVMGIMDKDKGGHSKYWSAENIRPVPQERVAAGQ
jgi:hypothetical protein